MNGSERDMLTPTGLPEWAAITLGIAPSREQQFEQALAAFARQHSRPKPPTPEQVARLKRAAKRNNPLHVKAVAKRRKRKRGGPK